MQHIQNLGKFLLTASLFTSLSIFSANSAAQAQYLAYDQNADTQHSTTKASSKVSTPASANLSDAKVIAGVNTAGTVRVNNLGMLEALINIGANGTELISIGWGASLLLLALMRRKGKRQMVFACCLIATGLAVPGAVTWLLSAGRDANLFS